jgi:hypothetical protein
MAYKKDIKPWLKENNLTWEDVDRIWKECCEVNKTCEFISKSGKTWNDLSMHLIKQLPTLKEETLKQQKEQEEAEKRKAKEERIAKEKEEYYWEHFDKLMVQKIDSGEKLSENELRSLVFENGEESEWGENRRWTRRVATIVKLCGRYFAINWEEGLTEYQENAFYEQPYEVEKRTYEKTITVTEWIKK